jgi:hypothetical protein
MPILATNEKRDNNNLEPTPTDMPNAIPGFSTKVILKKSPITFILCP